MLLLRFLKRIGDRDVCLLVSSFGVACLFCLGIMLGFLACGRFSPYLHLIGLANALHKFGQSAPRHCYPEASIHVMCLHEP